ncbi:MAG: prevent-host-death protein [Betaproteobacteria bacterium]|nr:prevent-host-death protein [Betaproteobacteria bacterium]
MSIETTYSQARAVVVVKRRGHPAVAMIAADELASLLETAHLLRSPANAARLLAALGRSRQDTLSVAKTVSVLRQEVGLDE